MAEKSKVFPADVYLEDMYNNPKLWIEQGRMLHEYNVIFRECTHEMIFVCADRKDATRLAEKLAGTICTEVVCL